RCHHDDSSCPREPARAAGARPVGPCARLRPRPARVPRFLAREYGDLVPLRLTPFRGVFVNHPELIEEVLVSRHRSFRKSLAFRRAKALLGNGLILSEGEFWRRERRLMQPASTASGSPATSAMLAQGQTNAQIADHLSLSHKTVAN